MTGRTNVTRQTQRGCEDARELLGRLRETTERWALWERTRNRLTSGVSGLDAILGGGWPCGRVAEIVGPASSGRTGIAVATAAAATFRGEVVAWIDAADAFMPPSGEAAGVDLERVLWVRPAGIGEAVRATELVLETGGFPVVVLDLAAHPSGDRGQGTGNRGPGPHPPQETKTSFSDPRPPSGGREEGRRPGSRCPVPGRRGGGAALRLRLARAVERAGAVVLVLVDRSWAGTMAGVTVVLGRSRGLWSASGRGAPGWLAGLEAHFRVERGSFGTVGRDADLRLSWSKSNADGGGDADRLPANTRFSSASTAAC